MRIKVMQALYARAATPGETIADGLKKLIESVTQIECCDTDVLNIILEEVPAFFLDQRSVDDVCKNIQNRASLVVQER